MLLYRYRRRAQGVTLIEMLIVVAIMAIFAAGLLAVITAPGFEQKQAMQDQEMESGAGLLLSRIVEEAHSATSLEARDNRLAFRGAGLRGGDVLYAPGAQRRLHRLESATTETLGLLSGDIDPRRLERAPVVASGLERLAVEPIAETPGLWRVNLSLKSGLSRPPVTLDRQMDVAVGKFWTGGAR